MKDKKEKFEELLKRLETIVDEMENGSLELEKSIALYEEGVKNIEKLNGMLNVAREKVMKLVIDKNGKASLEPFDGETSQ